MAIRYRSSKLGLAAVGVFGVAAGSIGGCTSTSTPVSAQASVTGVVTDSTGHVLSGVTVTAGGAKAVTAANGSYSLSATPQAKLIVDFAKSGYLETTKAIAVNAGDRAHLGAFLMPMASPQPLDATQGGSVAGARGATLTASAGVLVDAHGNAVSGPVQVSLTPLSPANPGELAAYPGSLEGSVNGGRPGLIKTYGVLDVTVMQNGQTVQVAPGQTVSVTIPVAPSANLPSTQDLWSYNLQTGVWDHEGTAQLAASGSAYTAQLAHFSYHNIDGAVVEGQATCVTGLVVDPAGKPVAGAYVSPSEGTCTDTLIQTDSNGRYCTWVESGQSATLTADGTSAPYGEGSITVTGGAAIPYPGSYTCSNLNCQSAPNIVLSQPPCSTSSDCTAGATCCSVAGRSMCLQSLACIQAQGGSGPGSGSGSGGGSGSGSSSGGAPSMCMPATTVTVTVNGQTYSWNCFTIETANIGSLNQISAIASSGGLKFALIIEGPPNTTFAQGETFPLGSDGGEVVTIAVSGTTPSGDTLGLAGELGNIALTQWSGTNGSQAVVTIGGGTTLIGEESGTAGPMQATATVSGTITASLEVLP